jgi:hypothetical protein
MSYTQGSWEFEAHEGGPLIVYAVDPTDQYNGQDICEMCCNGENSNEVLANARLICAAPDMLLVLSALLDSRDDPFLMDQLANDAQSIINNVNGNRR